jgi:dTDP-4-amino-4,6-dideoxygalactose transaminase
LRLKFKQVEDPLIEWGSSMVARETEYSQITKTLGWDSINTENEHVPFNKPAFVGAELQEIFQAIVGETWIAGNGLYTRHCEAFLSDYYNTPVLLTSSCTHALEMAAHLLELSPEDEVIVPSYTFVSTANAFALKSCRIKFAECDEYGQIFLESVQRLLTPKTKAVCVVHYAGNSADMDSLVALCDTHGITLIEDAAQALGARYKGQLLGTFGALACLSFHETKNITCGEGGALIINDPRFLDRAHYIREKGTNRTQFFEGMVDKYTWVDIGSSYVLSDMNAAYLWVQLQHLDQITNRRHEIWTQYHQALEPVMQKLGASILGTPAHNTHNAHLFALVFEQGASRSRFIQAMNQKNITAPFHYVALHQSPMGVRYTDGTEAFPNTTRLSEGLVRLPLFYNMTSEHVELVIQVVQAYADA